MKSKTFYKFVVIFFVCLFYFLKNINAEITAIFLNDKELKPNISDIKYACPRCKKHFEIEDKKGFATHIINECLNPSDKIKIYINREIEFLLVNFKYG